MSGATYFVQNCPTCGRRLEVRVEYLGRQVKCQHCQASFQASDPSNKDVSLSDSGDSLLHRVDELLASADQLRTRPR